MATTLHSWRLLTDAGVLLGIVHGHPHIRDGAWALTTAVEFMDRSAGYARTRSGTLYLLHDPWPDDREMPNRAQEAVAARLMELHPVFDDLDKLAAAWAAADDLAMRLTGVLRADGLAR